MGYDECNVYYTYSHICASSVLLCACLHSIELQVQEQPADVRSAVYSHLEAFVPCNKEALLKRLKKLSLNVQDDRLRNPLLKLKLAVCSAMPEQIARYNMDCLAKVAK